MQSAPIPHRRCSTIGLALSRRGPRSRRVLGVLPNYAANLVTNLLSALSPACEHTWFDKSGAGQGAQSRFLVARLVVKSP
jgi:hypothetical protein